MMNYHVIATIQSTMTGEPPEPVEIPHYRGDNLAVAISALAGAVTLFEEGTDPGYVRTLSVRMDFVPDDEPQGYGPFNEDGSHVDDEQPDDDKCGPGCGCPNDPLRN